MFAKRLFYVSIPRRPWLCVLLPVCLWAAPAAHAQVFHDDFDGETIDATKWTADAAGGTIVVSEGRATLSAPCGAQFPYITIKDNPFPPEGDFLVRVGFRYPDVGTGGNGFGFDYQMRGFGVWQDACCGPLRVCVGDLYPFYPPGLATPDTAYHVFEWRYVDGTYFFSLDGSPVIDEVSSFRPNTMFFGHPPTAYCPWTTQEIDFVHVEALGSPVLAAPHSWGSLKSRYR